MSTPTRLLDPLAKADHPVSRMFLSGFVGGTSGGLFLIGGILSRHLADEELGRSTK